MATTKTRKGKELQVPTVHLNGTSKDALVKNLENAYRALLEACRSLNETAPHGRDYCVQEDPEAFSKANEQYHARGRKLVEVMDELIVIRVAVEEH